MIKNLNHFELKRFNEISLLKPSASKMRLLLTVIILIHAFIHFMAFAKSFHWVQMPAINHPIPKSLGIIWFMAGIIFLVSLLMYVKEAGYWWVVALTAIFISQLLILHEWNDAKWGTLINIFILVPVISSLAASLPNSLTNRYKAEVDKRMVNSIDKNPLTVEDIKHLPIPIQNYLKVTNAIGKPQVRNLKAIFTGKMKYSMNSSWRNIQSEQYNFFDTGERIFLIKSGWFGIPFEGLHLFSNNNTSMQVKIASLLKVVDAKGEKMRQSETVTFFNDMCLLAPATLINKNIVWEELSPLKVKARFTLRDITIAATLSFNKEAELVDFISEDRYLSEDGQHFKNLPWSTPVESHKNFEGQQLIARARACWHSDSGIYSYASFNNKEIRYNCTI